MPILADDFIASAKLLCDKESEIDWRNSVSRAFYVALHSAKAFVEEHGSPDSEAHLKMGTHERVIRRLETGVQTPLGKRAAYILSDMKRLRTAADYVLSEQITQNNAIAQLETADRLGSLLATYS